MKYWTKTKIEIRIDVTVTGECRLSFFCSRFSLRSKQTAVLMSFSRQKSYHGDSVSIRAVYALVIQ